MLGPLVSGNFAYPSRKAASLNLAWWLRCQKLGVPFLVIQNPPRQTMAVRQVLQIEKGTHLYTTWLLQYPQFGQRPTECFIMLPDSGEPMQ